MRERRGLPRGNPRGKRERPLPEVVGMDYGKCVQCLRLLWRLRDSWPALRKPPSPATLPLPIVIVPVSDEGEERLSCEEREEAQKPDHSGYYLLTPSPCLPYMACNLCMKAPEGMTYHPPK